MNNFEAYAFLKENNTDSLSSLTRKFISQCTVKEEYFGNYRLKFVGLLKEVEVLFEGLYNMKRYRQYKQQHLMMVSNDAKDYTVSNICKEVVATGTFGPSKCD